MFICALEITDNVTYLLYTVINIIGYLFSYWHDLHSTYMSYGSPHDDVNYLLSILAGKIFYIIFPKISYTYWDNTSADEKPRLEKVAKCTQHVHVYACNALQFNINFPSIPHLQRGWFRFNWKQINELCRKSKKLGRSAKRIMKKLWIFQLCFKIGKYICIHKRFLKFRYFLYHGRLAVNL